VLNYKYYDSLLELARGYNYNVFLVTSTTFLAEDQITGAFSIVRFTLKNGHYCVKPYGEIESYKCKKQAMQIFTKEIM